MYAPSVRRAIYLACAVVLGLATGCVRVRPHERQILARPDMVVGADGDVRAGEDHARAYREGSSGGGQAHAGGCGCN